MSTTTTTRFAVSRDRAHRATCRKLTGREDTQPVSDVEAVQLAPASCCKPQTSAEWRAAVEEPATVELVYRSADDTSRAKHFWLGSGREGAAAYATVTGCEVETDNQTFTVKFTGPRAAEAAELTGLAWDAAAADLVPWRISREVDGYRGWVLRDRLAADREFMRSWHAGAAGELGAADLDATRPEAAALGAEWAAAVR